jgi:hypothetical protein
MYKEQRKGNAVKIENQSSNLKKFGIDMGQFVDNGHLRLDGRSKQVLGG